MESKLAKWSRENAPMFLGTKVDLARKIAVMPVTKQSRLGDDDDGASERHFQSLPAGLKKWEGGLSSLALAISRKIVSAHFSRDPITFYPLGQLCRVSWISAQVEALRRSSYPRPQKLRARLIKAE